MPGKGGLGVQGFRYDSKVAYDILDGGLGPPSKKQGLHILPAALASACGLGRLWTYTSEAMP